MRLRSLLCALLAVACKREQPEDVAFDQTEVLPGFTVSLPNGRRVKSTVAAAAGEIAVEHKGAVVMVGWTAGQIPKEMLPAVAAGLQAGMGAKANAAIEVLEVEVPAPGYASEFVVPTDKGLVLDVTVVQCPASNVTVTLATMAAKDRERARAFHQKLYATLRCGDEASSPPIDSMLPDFTLGDAIAYLPKSDPPAYFALSGERWYVTPGAESMRSVFEKPAMVAAMVGGFGLHVLEQSELPSEPDWLRVQLKVSIEGETGYILVGVLSCGDAAYSVIHTRADMEVPDPTELRRVHCPSTPVDASKLPTVADRFGQACEGGNAQACAGLALLVDEEPALLTGQDAAKLRTKACELGLSEFCAPQ